MSSSESDFNFDYGVSDAGEATHQPAALVLEAHELVLLKLLNEQPAVRETLPVIAQRYARATVTSPEGFLRGTRVQYVRARGRSDLPLLLQLRPWHGVPNG